MTACNMSKADSQGEIRVFGDSLDNAELAEEATMPPRIEVRHQLWTGQFPCVDSYSIRACEQMARRGYSHPRNAYS